MKIELKKLAVDDGLDVYEMLQEIDRDEYGFTNEVKDMSLDEYKQWLIREDDYSKERNLPENWIPQTTYILYVDTQPVGIARIRHHSSDLLEKMGVGNFGYGIAKPYRGKGYGNVLFQLAMQKCKHHGYDKIKSFVHIDNAASNKVFVSNGAKFLGVLNGEKNMYEIIIE